MRKKQEEEEEKKEEEEEEEMGASQPCDIGSSEEKVEERADNTVHCTALQQNQQEVWKYDEV